MVDKRDEAETDTIPRGETAPRGMLALDQQLCFAVYSAAHALNRTYKPLLDPYGLTYPQYIALMTLWQEDGRTVKALGADTGIAKSEVSRICADLDAEASASGAARA